MSRAFNLFRLQQVDTQFDLANKRLREIEAILNDDAALRKAQEAVAATTKQLDGAKKELRRAEENTKAQRLKVKNTNEKLYGGKIRNPKELQDLQMESEALSRYLEVLEERQLEAMLAVDEFDAVYQSAEQQLQEVRARQIESHAALNGEKSQLTSQVKQLYFERQMVAKPIDPDDLSQYDNLRKRRVGIAVAKVADKSCSACGTLLNTSLFQTALSPVDLTHCDNCGRILYAG